MSEHAAQLHTKTKTYNESQYRMHTCGVYVCFLRHLTPSVALEVIVAAVIAEEGHQLMGQFHQSAYL